MSGISTNQRFAILVASRGGLSMDTFSDHKELLASAARRVRSAYGDEVQIEFLRSLIAETEGPEPCPECRENDCNGECMEVQ